MIQSRASQNPIRPIRRTRAADFGPSLSMFKKAADIEVSYKTMYVCTAAENFFVTSWFKDVIHTCHSSQHGNGDPGPEPQLSHGHPPATYFISPENRMTSEPWAMVTLQLHISSVLKTNTISEPQVSHGHPPATYIISPENKHDIRASGEPWSPPATYIISPENKHDIRASGEPWSPSSYIHHQSWKQTHWYQSLRWAMVTLQLHTSSVLKTNTLISEPQVSHGHPPATYIISPENKHTDIRASGEPWSPPATYIISPESKHKYIRASGEPWSPSGYIHHQSWKHTASCM